MSQALRGATSAATVLGLLLSPAFVALGPPIGIGIVRDVLTTTGPGFCALALEALAAILIARRLMRQSVGYVAAKSMS